MTIKILPPQLANQIAAGEVVERPASVVKELVENALDAGATKVEIDIERGGHKKILIKDNGKGIPKDQLALALSRHATSKISEMDDLEAIVSLGFRGEALASISSVARLTMTSKPESQEAAWSAIAEGLDMQVDVKPAAHPNGTSVEVLDLFFNTPARRKFLRAEKTEFSHIETLIRRIAMSRPDVTFVLHHNSKVVKRFRAQATHKSDIEQQTGRIAEVINQQFVDSASIRQSSYDNVSVKVWAKSPELCKSVNPSQYAFVNGRMMRDKLIQHAIRQAYADSLMHEQQPEYVLFVELPATDVDVNVHPAKHEVRFHYARLLHDLIVGSIQECLSDFHQQQMIAEIDPQGPDSVELKPQKPDWVVPSSHFEHSGFESRSAPHSQPFSQSASESQSNDKLSGVQQHSLQPLKNTASQSQAYTHTGINKEPLQAATSFPGLKPIVEDSPRTQYSEPVNSNISNANSYNSTTSSNNLTTNSESLFEIKTVEGNFALVYFQDQYWIVAIDKLVATNSQSSIDSNSSGSIETSLSQRLNQNSGSLDLSPSPLLVPIRVRLNDSEKYHITQQLEVYKECGFDLKLHQHFLIVKQVPSFIRSKHSGTFLPEFFSLALVSHQPSKASLIDLLQNPQHTQIQNKQIQQQLYILVKERDFNIKWQSIAKPLRLADAFNH